MKAIDIIKRMVEDSDIAAHAQTTTFYEGDDPGEWANDKFGADIVFGNIGPAETEYLYLYGIDIVQSGLGLFVKNNKPDAHMLDRDGTCIYLWRIE